MLRLWLITLFAISFGSLSANGLEALGACKDIATVINHNDTKSELVHFNGNITIFAMLNSSLDSCIEKAELINDLHTQLLSSQYYQMNFVILDTSKGDQQGDRQNSQRMLDAASNITVLSNAVHNITGLLNSEHDYVLVINRCGRQIFQMIDPCSIRCSDLKTAIFTTFYDNVYHFCGDCQTPYATPVHENVQNLHPDFYRNIDNCGDLSIQETTTINYPFVDTAFMGNSSEETDTKNNTSSPEYAFENTVNTVFRNENHSEESKESKVIPINIHFDLPDIHTINYKITRHSQNTEGKNVIVNEEVKRSDKNIKMNDKNMDNSDAIIETHYFDGKQHKKHHQSNEQENKNDNEKKTPHESVEEIINDNIIEFANSSKSEYGFKLTDRHALFHLYSKMLPKLRQLLDQKGKKE